MKYGLKVPLLATVLCSTKYQIVPANVSLEEIFTLTVIKITTNIKKIYNNNDNFCKFDEKIYVIIISTIHFSQHC